MKKRYFSPTIATVEISCDTILALTKVEIDDGSGDEQLSNKYRGDWGNIWGE